jgi:peptidoglycan/LPS O-acetylase OafA/YrhL
VLALWVTIGHCDHIFPLFAGMDVNTPFGRLVTHAWSAVFFGNPAVIAFFVISGFCIHLPYQGREPLPVGRYYLRRYVRILIPVAGALLVYSFFGSKLQFWGAHSILWASPLWSLACEEIYYAAYPLLRLLRNRIGWKYLLPPVFVLGALTSATNLQATSFQSFGPFGTSLILLPAWLLGSYLAEQSGSLPAFTSVARIWAWRVAILVASGAIEFLHFKTVVHFPQTMVWFGVLAYFWIKNEIAYSKHKTANPRLVAAGAWSYSLYLVHTQGMAAFWKLPIPNLGYFFSWLGPLLGSLASAYSFYLLVERPSHRLARRISATPRPIFGNRVARPAPIPAGAVFHAGITATSSRTPQSF